MSWYKGYSNYEEYAKSGKAGSHLLDLAQARFELGDEEFERLWRKAQKEDKIIVLQFSKPLKRKGVEVYVPDKSYWTLIDPPN